MPFLIHQKGGENLIKVYNYSVSTSNPVAILQNAFGISYEKRLNEVWTAQFSMPADDPKNAECLAFRYVEIFDGAERVDLFRILPSKFNKSADGKTINYQCEHVLSTLLDDLLFQCHIRQLHSITNNISYILGFQSTARWQIGTIDFTNTIDFKWENENLLSALFSMTKALTGVYQWTWDTSSYPWTINLIVPSSTPTATIRYKKNLAGIVKDEDPSYIITRLYPLGYGEGVNQLDIKKVNGGIPYINASTIGAYGVIATTFVDKAEESAQTLKNKATAYLETIKIPRVVYTVDGADIYSITNDSIDKFRDVGIVVNVIDDDLGSFNARIVNVGKSDLTGSPGDIKIQISNKLLDSADTTTDIQSRQHINDVYAQGATNIDSNDYQDNCDNTHPATIEFYLPSETVIVNKCLLTYKTDKFRAYETGAAAGGSSTATSSSGGSSTATSSSGGGATPTSSSGGGATTDELDTMDSGLTTAEMAYGGSTVVMGVLVDNNGVLLQKHLHQADIQHSHDIPAHTHTVSVPTHTHDVAVPAHTHDVVIPAHTHAMIYGIYEFGFLPPSLVIKVDGTVIPITALTGSDIDIVPYLSMTDGKPTRGAFHKVEIYPDVSVDNPGGLARITAAIVKQVFIQSRGDYSV